MSNQMINKISKFIIPKIAMKRLMRLNCNFHNKNKITGVKLNKRILNKESLKNSKVRR